MPPEPQDTDTTDGGTESVTRVATRPGVRRAGRQEQERHQSTETRSRGQLTVEPRSMLSRLPLCGVSIRADGRRARRCRDWWGESVPRPPYSDDREQAPPSRSCSARGTPEHVAGRGLLGGGRRLDGAGRMRCTADGALPLPRGGFLVVLGGLPLLALSVALLLAGRGFLHSVAGGLVSVVLGTAVVYALLSIVDFGGPNVVGWAMTAPAVGLVAAVWSVTVPGRASRGSSAARDASLA